MNHSDYLKRNQRNDVLRVLSDIEKLPVKHQRAVCKMWYESYFDETATEWFNNHVKDFTYFFTVENNICRISVSYTMWGSGELIECRGRTTREACRKAITKFYKQYGLQRTNQKN